MSPEGALVRHRGVAMVNENVGSNDGKILKGCFDLPHLSNPESYNLR
jgi:hypothetical protein